MQDRGLRPAEELFADKEHGTRYRYMAGCKCFYCRRANSDYERERKEARERGDWNGLVPADRARKHIEELSRQGVGRRTLSARCGVGDTVIQQIKSGRKTQIRARTERKILEIAPIHQKGSTLVDATEAWSMINQLLIEGFTKTRIAAELGYKGNPPALQLNRDRITAENARKVRALYRKYMYMN